jgi:hypothetical protein
MKAWQKCILVTSVILIAGSIAFYGWYHESYLEAWSTAIPAEYADLSSRIWTLHNESKFDDAVHLGTEALRGTRSDDVVLMMISDTYFVRAQEDRPRREQWARAGVQFAERSREANPDSLVGIYRLGHSYKIAGEDIPSEACAYAWQALGVYSGLLAHPALSRQISTIDGHKRLTIAWRNKLKDEIAEVKGMYRYSSDPAGCPR